MDPFDKSQTDPIWQRVWNRQPSASPSRPAPPQSPAPPVTPQPVLSPPEMSWTHQELLRQAWEEEGFGRQCQALSRSMGTGGREALLRLHRQAMERAACLRGMARSEQGGRPRPQPRQEPRREPVERALLRLLIHARQFENLYSDSQNHPTFGPVFAQFRQEMVQAVRVLLFLLGSQGR